MTTTKRQRKMPYRSSVTVNFVCATKFCFDPPFLNGSSPRVLSAQYSAHHTSRKSQLARFPRPSFLAPWFCELIRNIKLCVTIFIWLENTCASNIHHLKNYWLFLYFRTLMVTSSASCYIWRIAVFALLNRIRIHS